MILYFDKLKQAPPPQRDRELGLRDRINNGVTSLEPHQSSGLLQSHSAGQLTDALVYLSTKYIHPGPPWDEYIERMSKGLEEAIRQGISTVYVAEECGRGYRRERGREQG